MLQANIFLTEYLFSMLQANFFLIENSLSNVTTIHRDPENRAKDVLNSTDFKCEYFLIENSFSMLQANIFLIKKFILDVPGEHFSN